MWEGKNPGETIEFTIAPVNVAERTGEVPPVFGPAGDSNPVLAGFQFNIVVPEDGAPETATIAFPTFPNVGTYYYTITETAGNTAGVTYKTDARSLKIVVVRNDAGAFVPYMYSIWLGESKVPGVKNDYEASNLVITKATTGNLGDKDKLFDVVVTFTKPANKTIGSTISYNEGTGGTIAPSAWTENTAQVTVQVKDGTVITFENIPKGVTWKVDENPYADYDTAYDSVESDTTDFATGVINSKAADTVLITNNRNATPETGISLDSLPYIMLLGFAVVGMSVLFFRRRRNASF